MLQLTTYVILCSIFGAIIIMYHKMRGRQKRVLIEIAGCLGIFFIVGLLTLSSAIEKKKLEIKFDGRTRDPEYGAVQRFWVEKYPNDSKVQITFLSIMGDTTYTIILTKEESEKLKKELP